jgi:hypothetical protein
MNNINARSIFISDLLRSKDRVSQLIKDNMTDEQLFCNDSICYSHSSDSRILIEWMTEYRRADE